MNDNGKFGIWQAAAADDVAIVAGRGVELVACDNVGVVPGAVRAFAFAALGAVMRLVNVNSLSVHLPF